MNIEIKKSQKPVKYEDAMAFMEKRLYEISKKKSNNLIWVLEHEDLYTAGTSFNEEEILDKSIKIIKTNRGGKITWHGPGQLICYFVIDLNKRNKDIRNFIKCLENVIIKSLKDYQINSFPDRKNIGIWIYNKKQTFKVGAIGLRIKKWIAYHGFSLNINNDLTPYKNIIPCGITDRDVTSLKIIKKQNYKNLKKKIIKNFIQILDI